MDMRRYYAWKRREVSKTLISEMEAGSGADMQLDQYEFMVASLLMLNKINSSDVQQIMDKYRELAGSKGVIHSEDLDRDRLQKAERDDRDNEGAEDEDMHYEVDK